jgi:hypothetical protein
LLKRIAAITGVFGCTTIAWMILAGSISSRTEESNDKLKPGVSTTWGAPQEQVQPAASYEEERQVTTETVSAGKKVATIQAQKTSVVLPADSSRVQVNLALEYRQKGLLWYSVYVVDFTGAYAFRNPSAEPHLVTFHFPLPAAQAIYDGLEIDADGRPLPFTANKDRASASLMVAGGQTIPFRVSFRSQGMESWRYRFGDDITQTRDFELIMKTGFREIDFPFSTLSPTGKRITPRGWDLTWRYRNLISGFQIGMTMPQKLQPGPLAGDISRFAPISLLLFFFAMFILTTVRNIDLHPMNYFFLAAAFFAFHLLLAYLVDHVSIQWAFAICSLVSASLVVSYLRLVVGSRFAIVEAGLAQLIYLVLFSATFFLPGFTGLAITIGCIVTLFLAMQVTARIRWSEQFAALGSRP